MLHCLDRFCYQINENGGYRGLDGVSSSSSDATSSHHSSDNPFNAEPTTASTRCSDDTEGTVDEGNSDNSDDEEDHVAELNADTRGVRICLHPAVVTESINCPPFLNIQSVWQEGSVCDCVNVHHLPRCCQTDNFDWFSGSVEFSDDDFVRAGARVNDLRTKSNRRMRYNLYKQVLKALDFGDLGVGERRALPVCVVSRIRQLYPSVSGYYRGYSER